MRNKINIDDLYVVCKVSEFSTLEKPYIKYECIGKELHKIYITPKMLLTQKVNKDGKEFYRLLKTYDRIKIINPPASFYVDSYVDEKEYIRYVESLFRFNGLGYQKLSDLAKDKTNEKINQYGYIMPFKEYVKNVINVDLKNINLLEAKLLLMLINNYKKGFLLDTDESIAENQINKKVKRLK